MARFFVPHSESDVQVLEQPSGGVALKIAWMPPAMRWRFFGIVTPVIFLLVFFAAGPPVFFALAPSIVFVLAVNIWSYTRADISEKELNWKIIPFPARRPRKLKLQEAESMVYGQVYVKLSKRRASNPTYGVGIRKKNGKIWTIHDGFDSPKIPLHIAKLLSANLPGTELTQSTVPGVKSASWQMMTVVLAIPFLAAILAIYWTVNS
jgi:hypothetical protein